MISVLALDIDGVLTDGRVIYDEDGRESKALSYRDIDAVYSARRRGLQVVLVTAEATPWVEMISRRLKVSHVFRGAKDKARVLEELCTELGVDMKEVCFVGDSLRDADALAIAGVGLAPSDAARQARKAADRVLKNPGGSGAVAEAVELVLEAREKKR
jgi:YrbI family 3-deoxy-D-manno-octulosonate 8-phosphate phosphatase